MVVVGVGGVPRSTLVDVALRACVGRARGWCGVSKNNTSPSRTQFPEGSARERQTGQNFSRVLRVHECHRGSSVPVRIRTVELALV